MSPFWIALPSSFLFAFSLASKLAELVLLLILLASGLVLLSLAFSDARQLRLRAIPRANPLWMILGPLVYMFFRFRATRSNRSASSLLLVILTVQCGLGLSAVFLYYAVTLGIEAFYYSDH